MDCGPSIIVVTTSCVFCIAYPPESKIFLLLRVANAILAAQDKDVTLVQARSTDNEILSIASAIETLHDASVYGFNVGGIDAGQ